MENDEKHQRKTMKKQERTRKTPRKNQEKPLVSTLKSIPSTLKHPRVQTPDLEVPLTFDNVISVV